MTDKRAPATIEELKDIIALAIEAADCAFIIARDGSLDFSDIGAVWSVVEKIGPAIIGIGEVPKELADMSVAECDELIAFVLKDLDMPGASGKEIVEKCLKAFKACYEVYLAVGAR